MDRPATKNKSALKHSGRAGPHRWQEEWSSPGRVGSAANLDSATAIRDTVARLISDVLRGQVAPADRCRFGPSHAPAAACGRENRTGEASDQTRTPGPRRVSQRRRATRVIQEAPHPRPTEMVIQRHQDDHRRSARWAIFDDATGYFTFQGPHPRDSSRTVGRCVFPPPRSQSSG